MKNRPKARNITPAQKSLGLFIFIDVLLQRRAKCNMRSQFNYFLARRVSFSSAPSRARAYVHCMRRAPPAGAPAGERGGARFPRQADLRHRCRRGGERSIVAL